MKNSLVTLSIVLGMLLLATTSVFGQATPQRVTLFIGPIQVDCEGEAPQKCLLVRKDPTEPYGLFYDPIEGFDFRKGREYELRVAVEEIENPPADASSLRWRLVEVVSSTLSLEGNRWRLDSFRDSSGQTVNVFPGSRIRVEFRDGQLTGNAGCNNYFGSYTVDGQNIQISEQVGMTGQLCHPEEVAKQEQAYLRALLSTRTFVIENEQLQLADAEGNVVATFSVLEPLALVGTPWTVLRYNNGRGGVTSVIRETEITAVFAEDGTLSGSAGCNDYSTTYQTDGNSITISDTFALTQKLCSTPEGIDQQEREYLAALVGATTFELTDNGLEMRGADGQRMLSFRAKSEIRGIVWQWQFMHELDGNAIPVPDPTRYTLTLNQDGNTAQILADCNSASGIYTISGNRISVEVETMTQALCAPESLSDQFLLSLSQVEFYESANDSLFLSPGADGGILIFGRGG